MAKKVTPHYTLVAPSADGTCCPCSALSDPCTCAGLVPIIRCRTRSALAELCGWGANSGFAEDPPRKWHYKELSGALTFLSHQYDCSTGDLHTQTYSGRVTPAGGWYEPRRCSFTPAESGWMEDTYSEYSGPTRQVYAAYHEMRTTTITATTTTYTGNGYCRCDGSTWCKKMSGTAKEKLVEEDTEQQALYRATKDLQWSDWVLLTVLPGCSALWELRSGTTDYDFSVREAEYQLEFPALTVTEQATDPITGEPLWQSPGVPLNTTRQLTAQVEVRVDILRRPWNGGLWTLYKTEAYGPMTITGTQTLEGVVPNDRGYETAINNVRYRVVG